MYIVKALHDDYSRVYPAFLKVSEKQFFKAIRRAERSGLDITELNYEFFEVKRIHNQIYIDIIVSQNEKKYVFETIFYEFNDYLIS